MPVIVVSYRRRDSNEIARCMYDHLVRRYGERSVYIDIKSIQPSADYRVHIRRTLERALVLLAVIGKEWSGPRTDREARIFDRDDPVRVEVETALLNRRAVIPVLVNGASMPLKTSVPASLKLLPHLHAVRVSSGDQLPADLERLFLAIDRLTRQFWTLYVSMYLMLPFVLMLASHYLILFKLDLDPLYLRVAVAAISAVLGLGLCFQIGFRTVATFLTGAAVGICAAVGMLAVNAALSDSSAPFDIRTILPSITRDWQEVVEYVAIVTAATLCGHALGRLFREWRTRFAAA